jgi:DNA-binding MarR family transcriptional regulator
MTSNTSPEGPDVGTDTRWLGDAELAQWMMMGRILSRLPAALERQLERDSGLSWTEYHTLAMLSEKPNRTRRMSELAEVTNASLSRLSHLVNRLEQRGYIRREPDSTDGRYTNAILTDDGYAKLVASAPSHAETVRSLVFDVAEPGEMEVLRKVFGRISATIDESGLLR